MGEGGVPSWVVSRGLAPLAWSQLRESIHTWLAGVTVRTLREHEQGDARLLAIEYAYAPPAHQHDRRPPRPGTAVALAGWLKDARDGRYTTSSDEAWLQPGWDPGRTLGEFALARVTAAGVSLTTDLYATRPIYYFYDGSIFIAASDLRLLLCCEQVPAEPRLAACQQFLGLSVLVGENELPAQHTFFRRIAKLPPATCLWVDDRGLHEQRYFHPDSLIGDLDAGVDHVAAFRRILDEATADRLRAGATTLHLSGGVDSSTVLAAARHSDALAGLSAVNMSFHGDDLVMSQDGQLARRLIRELGLRGAILWGDQCLRIPSADLDADPLVFLDGPDTSANPLAKEALASYMQSVGACQALTGECGDVLLGEQAELVMLDSLVRAGRLADLGALIAGWTRQGAAVALRNTFRYVLTPFLPWLRQTYYCRNHFHPQQLPLIPHYFSDSVRARDRQQRHLYSHRYSFPSPHRLLGHRYMQDFLWPRAAYFDSMGAYFPHSHPFLDRRLLAFLFRAPTHIHCDYQSLHLGSYAATKMLARRAYQGVLPDYVRLKKTKTSYAHMARRILLNSRGPLLDLFSVPLPATVELGLIDRDRFWKHLVAMLLRAQDPSNDLGMSYHYLRGVIDLEIWLRTVRSSPACLRQRIRLRPPRALVGVELL
jgi:asparagine synthase (glutamine-hydrolysing)